MSAGRDCWCLKYHESKVSIFCFPKNNYPSILNHMKNALFILPISLFLFVGCASQSPTPSQSQPGTGGFSQIRASMHDAPVPFPNVTPFDSQPGLRSAYLDGFSKGWNRALVQGVGALGHPVSVPNSSQQGTDLTEAWGIGYQDGAGALWKAVEARAAQSTPKQ